ncbi:glycosyltransferase [Clostridium sp. 19966]|uniref:tetratricopeptide repeat-containing glycosyltransferase family 2 protein n=1 Tax=Clostridium sp. 19966 TaxID=2768166 RepID=UPI0028DFF85C|nr:glycosyltransferase [Clostridium sp. 19966]MDT8717983.1 glycosyltransferase [Clostridium sp. 19966]
MNNKLSVCMMVKNEEAYLPTCLKSIEGLWDELIIVDTGSTDNTIDICKSFGAEVHIFPWINNFSAARNESLKYATKDWILVMDADDEIFPEDKKNLIEFLSSDLREDGIYFFQTLSYTGDYVDENNITINLNPRLFKNHRGIHYEGEIHNQIVYPNNEASFIYDKVKIHHYGYLNKAIYEKNKRERNMAILKEQIKKYPEYGFAYFNLGNEYSALSNPEKALECYYKSYEYFEASRGYSSILLIKLVHSNYLLKNYEEALKFISIGLSYFPKCTDLYYFKAVIFKELNKPTCEIEALKKCIELGEAPPEQRFLYGTGDFRALYELANVYFELNDYENSYKYYIEAMKSKKDFSTPIYHIAYLLKKQNYSDEALKQKIDAIAKDFGADSILLANLFFNLDYYEYSLEYIQACEENHIFSDNLILLKMKNLIRTKQLTACISANSVDKRSPIYSFAAFYQVLSYILLPDYEEAKKLMSTLPESKEINACRQLLKLLNNEPPSGELSKTSDDEYMSIIIEILELFLINEKFDELKSAVNLLTLVNDNSTFLSLGKLYFKYGYIDLAKEQVLNSIIQYRLYDLEALEILKA